MVARPQACRQVAVQLDHRQPGTAGQQRPGECTLAGTDFDQAIVGPWRQGRDDPCQHAVIVQEVLAEALARPVVVARRVAHARRAAIARASAAAARVLPIGLATAGQVQGHAVVHRGAHEGQAQGDVDRGTERQGLEHRQALIVVHGEIGIKALPQGGNEGRIGGQRSAQLEPPPCSAARTGR